MNEHQEIIQQSEAKIMAAELVGNARTEYLGQAVRRSIQIPPMTAKQVAALAQHSGNSQNQIICRLMAVGLEAVKAEMTQDEILEMFNLVGVNQEVTDE